MRVRPICSRLAASAMVSSSTRSPSVDPNVSDSTVTGWAGPIYTQAVRKPLRSAPASDDGETLGALRRPIGGFAVAKGYGIVPTVGQQSADERTPSRHDEPWLVPQGRPEVAPWPRNDPRWVEAFAGLHRQRSDKAVAVFASQYGWLSTGTLIAPVAVDRETGRLMSPGVNDPTCEPVRGDRVATWRRESADFAELRELLEDSGRVGVGQTYRQRVLRHFTGETGTLWWRAGDRLSRANGGDWRVEDGGPRDGPPVALAFVWGGQEKVSLLPLPIKDAPDAGSNLAVAEARALGELARYAVAVAIQQVLAESTGAVLTLRRGIRVAPRTLLGALYLSLARELFNRRADKTCPTCHEQFTPIRKDQIYCNAYGSQRCRSKANYPRGAAKGTDGKRKQAAQVEGTA